VYRLLEHDILKQLLIKEEQIRLTFSTNTTIIIVGRRSKKECLRTILIREEIGEDATDDEIQHSLR
jgi:hypothetical protein